MQRYSFFVDLAICLFVDLKTENYTLNSNKNSVSLQIQSK